MTAQIDRNSGLSPVCSANRADQSLTALALVDRCHLARFTLGDAALESEILGLFAGQAPSTLADLAQSRSPKEWLNAAHTLKGSARAIGAWQVAACAEALEKLEFPARPEERERAMGALKHALDDVYRWIEAFKQTV